MNRFNLVKLPKILISLLKLNSVCWVFFFKFDPVSSFCVCLCVIVQKESAQSALVAAGQVYYNVTMCVCVCSVEGQIHLNMFWSRCIISLWVSMCVWGGTAGRQSDGSDGAAGFLFLKLTGDTIQVVTGERLLAGESCSRRPTAQPPLYSGSLNLLSRLCYCDWFASLQLSWLFHLRPKESPSPSLCPNLSKTYIPKHPPPGMTEHILHPEYSNPLLCWVCLSQRCLTFIFLSWLRFNIPCSDESFLSCTLKENRKQVCYFEKSTVTSTRTKSPKQLCVFIVTRRKESVEIFTRSFQRSLPSFSDIINTQNHLAWVSH